MQHAHQPILDEPTEGIQPNIVSDIGVLIQQLNCPPMSEAQRRVCSDLDSVKRELGVTVLLAEQKLPFACKVADQFFIMDRGRGLASGAMAELSDEMVKQFLTV